MCEQKGMHVTKPKNFTTNCLKLDPQQPSESSKANVPVLPVAEEDGRVSPDLLCSAEVIDVDAEDPPRDNRFDSHMIEPFL